MWNRIKNNWKIISIYIILIIVFLLGKSCGNSTLEIPKDYITVTKYKDTIFPKDTVYVLKTKQIPYPVYIDTNTYIPKTIDSLELTRFFSYKDTVIDSNIELYRDVHTQGKTLVLNNISYKLKVPLIIKDCTIVKKDSIIFKPSKYEFHVGLLISPNMLAPSIDLSINKCTYGIGYDPFNKNPIISFKYRIWKSKK